ncbi:response regulator, partial [Pseudomonas sp. KCJK8993]
MEKLKVIIADDHPIVLLGIRELMERDERFEIVGEAMSSGELVQLLESRRVDLVITDYNMPGNSPYGDGLKLVEFITRHFERVQILVLTMISNPLILSRLQELGVMGIIQKNQLHEEIQLALKAVAQKGIYRSPMPSSHSVVESNVALNERISALSPKEYEILRLFVSGKSVSEIARSQNRSSKT